MKRFLPLLQYLGLLAAVGTGYLAVVTGSPLWDDPSEIFANPLLRDPHGLARIWLGSGTPDYFPLKTSVQWLQWQWWGADVRGYHLTNLALHALAAFLVWQLFRRLGLRFAYFCALLFALHPLAVESVAWISELKNVLSLPLLLGAMLAYLAFDRTHRSTAYLASVLLFTAAMCAKTSVVMFPVVLILYAYWRHGQVTGRTLRAIAPLLVISLGLGMVTVHFQNHHVMAYLPMPAESLATRVAGGGWAIWFYLVKCLSPFDLMPIYPRWSLQPALVWLLPPWIALAAVFGWCWRARATWGRAVIFGLGSFVLNLVPVLGVIPLAFARISRVSDHLAYLSLVSIVALVGAAAGWFLDRSPGFAQRFLVRRVAAAAIVIATLAATRSYAAKFVSEETLWTYNVRRNPGAWLAQNNLGIVLAQSGRVDEALPHLQAAVALRPDLFGARMNLGRALAQSRNWPAAIPQFEAASALDPANADAKASLRAVLNNNANSLARNGHSQEAIDQYQKSLTIDPSNAETHRNLATALHALGRDREAYEQLDQAGRLAPSGR
jgi:tetratricopeptide (TPR) repeat protein